MSSGINDNMANASRRIDRLITAVFTLHNGDEVTAADAAERKVGTGAMQQFMAGKTAIVEGENDTTYIPFHSVIKVVVTENAVVSSFTDDFCGFSDDEEDEEDEEDAA